MSDGDILLQAVQGGPEVHACHFSALLVLWKAVGGSALLDFGGKCDCQAAQTGIVISQSILVCLPCLQCQKLRLWELEKGPYDSKVPTLVNIESQPFEWINLCCDITDPAGRLVVVPWI